MLRRLRIHPFLGILGPNSSFRLVINNYYTLHHLVNEWQGRIVGVALDQPFSQVRNELVVPFEPVERTTGSASFVVVISCEPTANSLTFRDSYSRARRNSVDVFTGLQGALVESVSMTPGDREIILRLRTGQALAFQFFGSRSNVLLLDAGRIITNAFLRPRSNVGSPHTPRVEPSSRPPLKELMERAIAESPKTAVVHVLKRYRPEFGSMLWREVQFRAGLDQLMEVGSSTPSIVSLLESVTEQLVSDLLSPPRPYIYYREREPVEFSIIPLSFAEGLRCESQPSISDGIRRFLGTSRQRSLFARDKDHFLAEIHRMLEQWRGTELKLRSGMPTEEDAVRYERYAKILQVHVADVPKGSRTVVLPDLMTDGQESVSIDLDPHLTPAKNIQRFFDKAKKLRTTIAERGERLSTIDADRRSLLSALTAVEESESPDELNTVLAQHREIAKKAGIGRRGKSAPDAEPSLPFRVFTVDGGFQVWAGKSGENNDLLTTRHTAKNDLWFHVRGLGGSHVVLKIGTAKGQVSKRAKEQAAGIAAYYSKMRKASHVAVTMCEGKYVRKPRGASTGTVVVERETVVFANPALPQTSGGDN